MNLLHHLASLYKLFGRFSLLFVFFFLQGDVIVHWNLLVNKHMTCDPEKPQLGNCESKQLHETSMNVSCHTIAIS